MTTSAYWKWPIIRRQVKRAVGMGIEAGAVFLTARLKEILSVPAPRKLVLSRNGVKYYRATTKTTSGAPPRKLSGRMRQSVTYMMTSDKDRASVGTNLTPYPRKHELGNHPWLLITAERFKSELAMIIAAKSRSSLGL